MYKRIAVGKRNFVGKSFFFGDFNNGFFHLWSFW